MDKIVTEAVKQALKLFGSGSIDTQSMAKAAEKVMKVAAKSLK